MSVVVLRDGVLAADSRAYGGHGQFSPGSKAKIHDLGAGRRVGVVSAKLGEPERFVAWLKGGGDPATWTGDKPDLRAILVEADGSVFLFEDSPWASAPMTPNAYVAIGSGSDVALGAMFAGATAERAVEAAIHFDRNSGGPVRILPAPATS